MIKAANARNRGRVCLCDQNCKRRLNSLAKSTHRIFTRFTSLLFAVGTSTVATVSNEVTMFTSTHNLPLSSLL